MQVDLNEKLIELETRIDLLTQQIENLSSNQSVETDLEEEIQEDIHCCFRFLRHFICFL